MNILRKWFSSRLGSTNKNRPVASQNPRSWPSDCSAQDVAVLEQIAGFTMTTIDRQVALIHALRHVVRHHIPGCYAECGVWRGGSTMAAALVFRQEGDISRDLYLFDTFEGMTSPQEIDKTNDGKSAQAHMDEDESRTGDVWAVASLEEVSRNMEQTGYPREKVHYVQGPVEKTIPEHAPREPIAVLRLDTDWYESTKHELLHLFPMVSPGGVVIIDDYGWWQGARRAVDEFLAQAPRPYFLHRIDHTGRLLVKT